MKSNIKTITIFVITLGIALNFSSIILNNLNFKLELDKQVPLDYINIEKENLEISKESAKIHIVSNWAATKALGLCTGSGTSIDPYIIEDLVIDAKNSGSGIFIENSDVYFRIENCTLFNSGNTSDYDAGITLMNVKNGELINNNLYENQGGIMIKECRSINISSNEVSSNCLGILLIGGDTNYISYNSIENNHYAGINLQESQNNLILENIAGNNEYGLYVIENYNNSILKNKLNNNREFGLLLKNSSLSLVSGNNFSKNIDSGIRMWYSDNNTIMNNSVTNNFIGGIFLTNSNNNLIVNNMESINKNGEFGIYLRSCDSNKILNNAINDNGGYGIYLLFSNFNNITQNSLLNNENKWIKQDNCEGNLITNNVIKYNKRFPFELLILICILLVMISGVVSVGIVYQNKTKKLQKQTSKIDALKAKEAKKVKEFNVFLSYSTKDADYFDITKIVNKLESYPEIKNVYFWEVDSGEDVVSFMEQTLKKINVFVLFCSENSINSKAVEGEWHAAYQLRKKELIKIIPVYKEENHIPFLLTPLLNVKFSERKFENFTQKLYEEILR